MKYGPDYLAPGLLALALCSPVHANEPIGHGDPAPDWTGFYFGAALATPHGDNFWTVTNLTDHDLVPDRWDGEAAMLTFGHDWQRGRLTFGAMLSVGHGTISAMPGDGVYLTCVSCETRVSNLISLRGRTGFASGETLFFASGGFARGKVQASNVGGIVPINEARLGGWTAGLGMEHRIGDTLTLALSYDHVDLGALDLSDYVPSTKTDITFGLMQVGMNVRW